MVKLMPYSRLALVAKLHFQNSQPTQAQMRFDLPGSGLYSSPLRPEALLGEEVCDTARMTPPSTNCSIGLSAEFSSFRSCRFLHI